MSPRDWNDLFKTSSSSEENQFNWSNSNHQDDYDMSSKLIQIISGVVIAIVLLAIVAFVLCLCCPICLLAKFRSRRRGFVYQTGTQASTVNVNVTRGQVNQPAIAIRNHDLNRPYPVQESVTVVPLVNPYSPPQSYPHIPQPMPNELPPPYPGLPQQSHMPQQQERDPPFNPYFNDQPKF